MADLSSKLVDFAREMNRPRQTVDYLWHSEWADGLYRYEGTEQAAQAAGIKLQSKAIRDATAIESAIATLKQSGATTLIIQPSPLTYQYRAQIIATAMRHGVGTIWAFPAAAREGGMIAYGPDYVHMYRRAPLYEGGLIVARNALMIARSPDLIIADRLCCHGFARWSECD